MKVRRERIIVEADGQGWLVMFPDGSVVWYASRAAILRAVKARRGTADVLVTEVEWR